MENSSNCILQLQELESIFVSLMKTVINGLQLLNISSKENRLKLSKQARRKVAAKCYQKGGAAEKSKLALTHDAVLKVHAKKSSPREKQMEYMTLAKTYLECGEPKLSLKCLIQSKKFRLSAELCKKIRKDMKIC